MEKRFSTCFTIIFNLTCLHSVSTFDSKLFQLLKFMDNNEEILVISGASSLLSKSDFDNAEEILSSSLISFSKGIPTATGNTSDLSFPSCDPLRTKIIAKLDTEEASTDLIITMSDLRGKDGNSMKDHWTLVLWPDSATGGADEKISALSDKLKLTNFMYNFTASSELYIGFPQENASDSISSIDQLYSFYEMYAIGGEIISRKANQIGLSFWSNNTGEGCESESCRRLDLNGINLRAQGVEDPEFENDTNYKIEEKTQSVSFTEGFSVQILHIAQQAMNFSYTASIMTPAKAKALGEVSSWDGVINRVEKGFQDMGISITVHLPQRHKRIHFITSTDEYIISAFFQPSSMNAIRDIFMQPFKADLWAAVISSWLVLAFSMVLFTVIRKRVGAMKSDEPDLAESSFIWALATACQQGWDEHPVAGSLRAIFISGSLTGVVAYAGYSAAIVSTLSLRSDPIKTPQDLIASHMSIGMRYGFLDNILSSRETDDIITRFYHRLSKKPNEARVNVSVGFALMEMKDFDYAFVCIRDTFYDAVAKIRDPKELCDLRDLQVLKHGFPAGPFLSRSSPYKEYFRLVITKIRERGVLWRLKAYYAYSRRCLASSDNTGLALGLNDVFTAFMILLGGYALSLTFLTVEKILYANKLTYVQ